MQATRRIEACTGPEVVYVESEFEDVEDEEEEGGRMVGLVGGNEGEESDGDVDVDWLGGRNQEGDEEGEGGSLFLDG